MADPSSFSPAPTPRDDQVRTRRIWPFATLVLIGLNFLVFGLEVYLGGTDNNAVLLNLGAAYGPYLHRGEYWRVVMPIFLHAGWDHLFGNTIVLFMLGRIMERLYGYGRYLTIYVVSGIGGALLSMSVAKNISVELRARSLELPERFSRQDFSTANRFRRTGGAPSVSGSCPSSPSF